MKMDDIIISMFDGLEDPRMERTKKYELIEILFLVLCSVTSGFSSWEDIEEFGESKIDWLKNFLPYKEGIPSHDTINRVLSMVSPKEFEKCLLNWQEMEITLASGSIINIDGKTISRSVTAIQQQTSKEKGGKQAVHILHAWCSSINMCLAQYKVDSKSNEITGLLDLISLLDISGCVVTTDSMNCHKGSIKAIVEADADYVIAVKANQPILLKSIEQAFQEVDGVIENSFYSEEKSHGRFEKRRCEVLSVEAIKSKTNLDNWLKIKTIIRTISTRKEPFKKMQEEIRYHISSLDADAKRHAEIIRSHWGVENKLHWVLDVCFNEDKSQKRLNNVAENFSTLRKLALNFLNNLQTTKKASIPKKMTMCALNDSIREQCLGLRHA